MRLWTCRKNALSSSLASYPSVRNGELLKDLSMVLFVIWGVCNSHQPLQRRCQVRSGRHTKCVQFSFSYIARSCSAETAELEIRTFPTASDGKVAYHEHLATSSPMPRDEPPVLVLCSYPDCHCPSEITGKNGRRAIAWIGTATLNDACLIR